MGNRFRKSKLCLDLAAPFVTGFFDKFHRIEYEGLENLEGLKDEPFFLLPNHMGNFDPPVEGCLLKMELNRYGSYIMRAGVDLPWWIFAEKTLPKLGAILIDKSRIALNGLKKQPESGVKVKSGKMTEINKAKRQVVKELKEQRKYIGQLMGDLLVDGEIVVYHPEGGDKSEGGLARQIGTGVLEPLMAAQRIYQKTSEKQIAFVPLDLDYEPWQGARPIRGLSGVERLIISASVKEPIRTSDSLELRDYLNGCLNVRGFEKTTL